MIEAQNKEWFGDWFDTSYYHTLYRHRDEKEAEAFLSRLSQFLKLKQGDRVLDLPCGKGRHAIYLAALGYSVEGADLAANSIQMAKPYEHEHLMFKVHDLRNTYAIEQFDYVFNLFTSFGYFEKEEEDVKAFKTLYDALKPGGILVMDFMNVQKVIQNLVASEEKEMDGIAFSIQRKVENGFIVKSIEVSDQGKVFHYQEKVKELYPAYFSSLLEQFGMKKLYEFGNYALQDFQASSSDRYIIIAQK
jgi:SAM-dependent methyltransferase